MSKKRMFAVQLTIDGEDKSLPEDAGGKRNPTLHDIERCIRLLDGRDRNYVLFGQFGEAEHYMTVAHYRVFPHYADSNHKPPTDPVRRFMCSVWNGNKGEEVHLNHEGDDSEAPVDVWLGGQNIREWREFVDIDTVLRAAKSFAQGGGLSDGLNWQRL